MPTIRKLIIDTDPGVDDALAILAAFNSPVVEVIGLTTVYGNVPTTLATQNALRLVEMAGSKAPVAQGALRSMRAHLDEERIADFVHGHDGFGNIPSPAPKGKAVDMSAAEFIKHAVNEHPGEVTILALAPLTNVAQALMLDPELGSKWAGLVILGGAFFCNGNVNPAAEANIFGDPDAADFVLGTSENIKILGLDVTSRCRLTGAQLDALAGQGCHGTFCSQISQFYRGFHQTYYHMDAILLHDPAALIAVLDPDAFTWTRGSVRVATEGVVRGLTVMDAGVKGWHGTNDWHERPKVEVALQVDSERVVTQVLKHLTAHGGSS